MLFFFLALHGKKHVDQEGEVCSKAETEGDEGKGAAFSGSLFLLSSESSPSSSSSSH